MEKGKIIAGVVVGGLAITGVILLVRKPSGDGLPPPEDGFPPGTECLVDTDCPDDFVCVDGQCIPR